MIMLAPSAAPSLLPLRDYQRAAVDAVLAAQARGVTSQLVSMPTGSGKTLVATYVIRETAPARTVLLVHRDELVKQSVRAIAQSNPGLSAGVVKAAQNQVDADVVVASVQTLAHQKRLDALCAALAHPRLLIVDECHHAVADTYRRAIAALNAELTIGLTATAYRADRLALGAIFEEVVYHCPMLPLIVSGRLANLVGLRIDTAIDLDDVHTVAGEFAEGELSHVVDTPSRNRLIVESWRKHAWEQGRRRTVAFCVDAAHAEHLRDTFRAHGIAAEMILGRTPTEERERLFDQFHRGLVPVLISVMVLSEGWDEPLADCGLMCRPTKSLGLYVQLAGRLARAAPGKTDALIVDFVDNTSRHRLVTLPTLAGREAQDDEEDAAYVPDARRVGQQTSLLDMAAEIGRVRHLRSVSVDLFGTSPYVWREAGGMWMTSISTGEYLALRPAREGYIPVRIVQPRGDGSRFQRPTMEPLFDRAVDAETARSLAEAMVPKSPLTDREARWREQPPSPAQAAFARRLGIPVTPDWTSGKTSEAIDSVLFARTIRQLKRGAQDG